MSESLIRQDWEGRSIDGKIPLLEWLGGAGDRGVFLTVRQGIQRAAIKLFVAGGEEAEAYLAQWDAARALTHPALMPILEFGRCKVDGNEIVYIITERAEDNLGWILKDRALTPIQAKGIFDPIVDALAFLHGRKAIHGHVKPSNLLAVGGKWKLATDDLWVAGGITKQVGHPDEYNAPEALDGRLTPAVDAWSVGMTLATALTQHLPKWNWSNGGAPAVPSMLTPEMARAVRDCLRVNPQDRCTMMQLKLRLDDSAAMAPVNPEPEVIVPTAVARKAATPEAPAQPEEAAQAEAKHLLIQEVPVLDTTAVDAAIAEVAARQTARLIREEEEPTISVPQAAAQDVQAQDMQEKHSESMPPAIPKDRLEEKAVLPVQEKAAPKAEPEAPAAIAEQKSTVAADAKSPAAVPPSSQAKETLASEAKRGEIVDASGAEAGEKFNEPSRSNASERAASDWTPTSRFTATDKDHEERFESSRSNAGRMLFALGDNDDSYEEERPRRRIWPWVLGGVLVLAAAAYFAVQFTSGNPPFAGLTQSSNSSSQPAAPAQTASQAQTQPAPQQPAPAQSTPLAATPNTDQSAEQPNAAQQSKPAEQPADHAAPGQANSAPAAQAPVAASNPAPVSAAPAKSATTTGAATDDGRSMEGVSRPRPGKGRGAGTMQSDADETGAARSPNANGEVKGRVVPNVSSAARSSMRRAIEVEIRVAVDRLGKVERTEYMDYGPGNYFARTAYRAAHDWQFMPPLRNGQPQASVWMLTFSFTRGRTEVTATEEDR